MAPKPTKPAEDEWQELNVRWFQFGTFCPILRVHGDQRPREPWALGGDQSRAYRTELAYARLRYQMLPYLYSMAWNVTNQGESFMRALVLDFPGDGEARDLTDEYMFGRAFLVAPVTAYKARTRSVYLPGGARWYDFWTGQEAPAGKRFDAKAPFDRMPLFVKAGSIIPFGPDLQYVAEKPQDPTTLYVYGGADGAFVLYEDDGMSYGYEGGQSAEIPMAWDDAKGVLTLGSRKGSYPGMLEKRTFRIVRAGLGHAEGYRPDVKPVSVVSYDGAVEELSLGK
jgi:alpha-D-xyloside xylohydrolase